MAGTRSTNTMAEGLMQMLSQVAQLMAAPDADLNVLSQFQQQLLDIIKAPQQQAAQAYAQAGGVLPGGGGASPSPGGAPPMPPPPTGMMPGMGGGGGAGLPPDAGLMAGGGGGGYKPWGVHGGNTLPSVDELRRVVASGGIA